MKYLQINLIIVLLIFCVISCDRQKNNKQLVINIDAILQQTDSINVYYTKAQNIDFNDKQSFWIKVQGSKKNQKVRIVFPKMLLPKQIRIDFGRNRLQPEIVLNKIEISYKQNKAIFKGKEVFNIFRIDENNTTLDKLNGSINRKVHNQVNGPSLYPKKDKLYKVLNQLYIEE